MNSGEEYWKKGRRELCYLYSDEYGTQYLFFWVIGNKRFKLRNTNLLRSRVNYLKTLREFVIGPEWKKISMRDYVLE